MQTRSTTAGVVVVLRERFVFYPSLPLSQSVSLSLSLCLSLSLALSDGCGLGGGGGPDFLSEAFD